MLEVDKLIKGNEEGIWVDFVKGTRIKLKPLKPARGLVIHKKCNSKKKVKGSLIDVLDEEKFRSMVANEVIIDWEGVGNSDGSPFECSPPNIKILLDASAEFNTFIAERSESLEEEIRLLNQEDEKN